MNLTEGASSLSALREHQAATLRFHAIQLSYRHKMLPSTDQNRTESIKGSKKNENNVVQNRNDRITVTYRHVEKVIAMSSASLWKICIRTMVPHLITCTAKSIHDL